ncbi:MAG: LysR substrate-binding domain-containing protein [Methylococcales bacterium]
MLVKPQHLLTFALVARLKSITGAAQSLYIGQPAVSGQLRLLQDTVGEVLYIWKDHQIVLTPAGEGLLTYANRVEREMLQTEEYIRCLQQVDAGALRIGSTVTIGSYYLPSYLVRIQASHPGLQVSMVTADSDGVIERLSQLDLGFIEGEVADSATESGFEMIAWKKDEIVLVLRSDHPLAQQYPKIVPLEAYEQYPVVWREPGSGARKVMEETFANAQLSVPINIEVTGVAGIKGCVRAGLGISYASRQALRDGDSELVFRRIGRDGVFWQLNILAREQAMRSRAARLFLGLCFAE